ncbi:MAG: PrgI family protein [Candidatus Magasanikbacteria bacterium]|nr:PrgI family protein [Candidatus Magasanikbacteria bacterium]
MQQFVVPQFIDVEDKIFGPITIRQFVILLVAGVVIFLSFRYGDLSLFIFTLAVVGGAALLFAFVKINGQNFHYFLLNILQTLRKPSLRIWNKVYTDKDLNFLREQNFTSELSETPTKEPVKRERIRDLALLANTGGFYKPEDTV